MKDFTPIRRSPFFKIMHGLNKENLSDHKVAFQNMVDMSAAVAMRKQAKADGTTAPTYTAFMISAITKALNEIPQANRIVVGILRKKIVQLHRVDITVAVERDEPGIEQAAFAATIYDTDKKDLKQLTTELRGIAGATPENNPRWRQFNWIVRNLPSTIALWVLGIPRWTAGLWIKHRGGAVMISSPAKYGVDSVIGAWPWPLGFSFGFVKDRPLADKNGQLVVRPTMTVTFSFDRRLLAGAPSARFFARVCELLEDPAATQAGGESA